MNLRIWSSVLVVAACAGHNPSVAFHVEHPSTDRNGNDLDDAPPSVSLRVGSHDIPAGMTFGWCGDIDKASPFIRESCSDVPPSTVASLACGDDPHVDAVVCLYAVRATNAVELWRRDVTFVDTDDAPRAVKRGALVRVGSSATK